MQKKPKVEKDTSERWLLTYSDLMNLLLILFIILYCASTIDAKKAAAVAESMREGFGYVESENTTPPAVPEITDGTVEPYWDEDMTEYEKFYNEVLALIKEAGLIDQVDLTFDDRGVVISFKDTALFPSGSAYLSSNAVTLIDKIGGMLLKLHYSFVLIEGHTDTDPIHTVEFIDNMDLSSQRAGNVWRELAKCGISPDNMASIGYGEYRPIVENDTPENKAKNRRVVITILRAGIDPDAQIAAGAIDVPENENNEEIPQGR